jgi:predicted acylesterase/phospholipase RssA
MSVALIKPYFASKLIALGYEEWPDGFGDDNIPSTLLDRSFHQRFLSCDSRSINQESFEMVVNHQMKVFFKGFNTPANAIDEGLVRCQTIVASVLNFADYTDAGIKGLFFDSFTVDPFDEVQNDNIIVGTLNFSVRVFTCIS